MTDSTYTFKVKGSKADDYQVTFARRGDNITAYCSCKAATFSMCCKHRINLMEGDVKAVTSP